MELRQLGNTDLNVSVLSFGASSLGQEFRNVDVNEALRTVEEGVVRSTADCDLAMVLGTGFPPFRGGIFAFGQGLGVSAVRDALERLQARHGERFRPAASLDGLV